MITQLRVQNFRKHEDLVVQFQPGATVITGPNGSGKTSLVEAVYIALQGKSWRSSFSEITKNDVDNNWWRIDVEFSSGEKRSVKFQDNKKTFEVDGNTYSRLPRRLTRPVILFEPNDLQIIYGSPTRRRDFIDRFISQLDQNYGAQLRKFNRVLQQRNNLLRSGTNKSNLFVWDIQFADLSEKILTTRLYWINMINQNLSKHYDDIAGGKCDVSLSYSAGHKTRNQILTQIQEDFDRNIISTRIGPQVDDIRVKMNGRSAKTTASRGENRTILFALIYSMVDLANQELGDENYLIFDDIDSELDDDRKQRLYESRIFTKNHVISTTIQSDYRAINHLRLG